MSDLPLAGRVAVVTGVSRSRGIGFAVASRLASMGASLFLGHHAEHDAEQHGGAEDVEGLVGRLRALVVPGASVEHLGLDLAEAAAADRLVDRAVEALGHLDVLVCNHAQSGYDGPLAATTADTLDRHWQVNARSTVLMTRAFAAQHDGRPGGRVVWMTSGQAHGPMADTVAYAMSKAALAGITRTVADDLVGHGVLLNTVNPGPVNTGYLDDRLAGPDGPSLLARFPLGRVGEPDDPARLIAWLVSDEGGWVVGQVLDSEGGFRRS
jgi:3-oxoacyl-[acyl-carrier protein] reductase